MSDIKHSNHIVRASPWVILTALTTLALFGCGGGGSGSGLEGDGGGAGGLPTDRPDGTANDGSTGGPPAQTYYPITTNNLRTWRVGETWGYSVEGSVDINDHFGAYSYTVTGIERYAVQPSPVQLPGPNAPRLLALSVTYSGIAERPNGERWVEEFGGDEYFYQDASGSIYFVLDDDGWRYNYPEGALDIKSPLGVGLSWLSDYRVVDPSARASAYIQERETCSVMRREDVTTPVGTFETFRVECVWTSIPSDVWEFGCPQQGTRTLFINPGWGVAMEKFTQTDLPSPECPGAVFSTQSVSTIRAASILQ